MLALFLVLLVIAGCALHRFPSSILVHLPSFLQAAASKLKLTTKTPVKPLLDPKQVKKERTFGTWTPEQFTYPTIEACTDFDIDAVKPIPYRPFR